MTSRYSSGGGGNRFQVRVGTHADGRASKLNLQITTQLAFTENDDKSIKIIRKAWDTFHQPNFDPAQSRNGVAIGLNNARVDKYYQSILAWATHSTDGDDFIERINKRGFSRQDRRTFETMDESINSSIAPGTSRQVQESLALSNHQRFSTKSVLATCA
jgi:hypothetical protein